MINGVYSAAASMDVLSQQQEIIADNLAHANSSGHRRRIAGTAQRFDASNSRQLIDLGPELVQEQRSFAAGRTQQTGRPLDVTIHGDGFFAFDKNGQEFLTRNGRLYRDGESGTLVNSEGYPLVGENGPITIENTVSDLDVTITEDGTVVAAGATVGKIDVLAFKDNQTLLADGETGFVRGPNSVSTDADVTLSQFQHELSNVEPVTELIALIVNSRQHEALERASRTISETLRDHIQGT